MTVVYADGGNLRTIKEMYDNYSLVKGFTSNPTLMKKDGVTDYELFAKEALSLVGDMPFSFEVFSDDFDEMERQARKISSWGNNVYVKIPITNSFGDSSIPLIVKLANENIKVNVTAIMSKYQALDVSDAVQNKDIIISVFAGRIADTGVNPELFMDHIQNYIGKYKHQKLLWASTREIFNYTQASNIGVDIITMPSDMIKKMVMYYNKSLKDFSLETVVMFRDDALSCNFKL